MNAFDVYKDYLALKQHFNKAEYDYVKYNGKMKLSVATFEKRKDKLFFQKLAKRADYHQFLLANLVHDKKAWIRDLAYSEQAEKVFTEWKKRTQSLTYTFKQDLKKLDPVFDKNLVCKDNEHPLLLKLYLSSEITLETLCILLDISGARRHWDFRLKYDPIWSTVSLTTAKYVPFIPYDKDTFKKIVLDFFN